MRVVFLTNISTPYRVKFFNLLGQKCDLTVFYQERVEPTENRDKSWENANAIHYRAEYDYKLNQLRNYDIVIVCGISSVKEMKALLYLKAHRIPYCLEIDGGFPGNDFVAKKWIKTLMVSGAKAYFSTGDMTDQYLLTYGAATERIHRYHFTSITSSEVLSLEQKTSMKCEMKARHRINGSFVFMYVGRFLELKGIDVLIKAFSKMTDDSELLLVGGEMTDEIRVLIEQNHLENVKVIKFVLPDVLREYYLAADALVFPTRGDVWGLVVNEAMACGLPVISSNRSIAGLELVKSGKNGYLFEKDNIDDLYEKMSALKKLSQSKYREYEIESLKTACEYTIDQMVADHLHSFSQIYAESKR